MDPKERVVKVFEAIAHRGIETAMTFVHEGNTAFSLPEAQLIIEPRLKGLEAQLYKVIKAHDLDDGLINTVRSAEAVSAFVVGILAGLDLAKRPDIVKKFAAMYGRHAAPAVDHLFDEDGGMIGYRPN